MVWVSTSPEDMVRGMCAGHWTCRTAAVGGDGWDVCNTRARHPVPGGRLTPGSQGGHWNEVPAQRVGGKPYLTVT